MRDADILEQLWRQHCDPSYLASSQNAMLWRRQVQILYAHHIAHPVALRYLMDERPTLQTFFDWISTSSANYQILNQTDEGQEDYLLSAEQLAFWNEHGYLLLNSVIDAKACADSRAAIWNYLGADPEYPPSWYSAQSRQQGLMLPLYNHPQLNTNRASRRLRAAYEQLYGSNAIYKTIDHVSFNPPETSSFSFRGDGLHWDVSLAQPIPNRFQGLLYLSDCSNSDGAFHCVPGFHRRIGEWLDTVPAGEDIRQYAAKTLHAQAVPGKAGDFVIWHQALPHCATANRGQTPRMVQYLSYIPENDVEQSAWI